MHAREEDCFGLKVRLILIFHGRFVLITLVDPLQSNYREHGESGQSTPAQMPSAGEVNTPQCCYET